MQLNVLVEQFDGAIAEKNAVEAEATKCQRRLDLAQRLMRSLGSEGARWSQTIDDLREQVQRNPGLAPANCDIQLNVKLLRHRDASDALRSVEYASETF